MRPSRRLDSLPVYAFASLGAKLQTLQAQGLDIIRLDIGSPDGPPTQLVIETLATSAHNPGKHGYPGFMGLPALRQAMADYYRKRFGVDVSMADEILPLIGSKEGIANMSLAWLDPGDLALVPDPGYPTYRMGAALAGADVYYMPLREENDYLPDLAAIPAEVADTARILWLNYPNNPTGSIAPMSFFEAAVDFCRRHDILLCHDVPYADVCFDGYVAPSLLAVPGAKEVAVEFNSLSKSHNMAGWRIGMAVGNKQAVGALAQIKTNIDSGMFLALQDAAIAALTEDATWMDARNAEYAYRRDLFYDVFNNDWGVHCHKPRASLYLWPRVPAGYTSAQCAEKVLLEAGVSLAPGTTFGPGGEGYLRVSVGQTTERVVEAVRRLRALRF